MAGSGYGLVYKAVMCDRRISIKAKAIYAYLCSYAGNKGYAYPTIDLICADLKINRDSCFKYLKELKEYGYVKVEKYRDNTNRFYNNVYYLKHPK